MEYMLEQIPYRSDEFQDISIIEVLQVSPPSVPINPNVNSTEEGFSSLSCRQNEYGSVVMTGRYTNGPIPYESIYFTLGIEDRNGNIVATGIGNIHNVGAYQTRIFDVSAGWEYDFSNCIIEVQNAFE